VIPGPTKNLLSAETSTLMSTARAFRAGSQSVPREVLVEQCAMWVCKLAEVEPNKYAGGSPNRSWGFIVGYFARERGDIALILAIFHNRTSDEVK